MRILTAIATLAVIMATPPAFAVGRFVYVDGTVNVSNVERAVRVAQRGEPVNVGDSISVVDGRAQVRFDDGGWISLEPRTVFDVREYARKENENIVLSLLSGSARVVTGLLTQKAPQRYRVVTPAATIGIRGTSFHVTYCQRSCDVPDGLYVTGGDGTIYVKNDFGEIDLTRGKTAYVAGPDRAPVESVVKPLLSMSARQVLTAVLSAEQALTAAMSEQQISTTAMGAQQMTSAAQPPTTTELRPGNFVYFAGTSGFSTPFQTISVTSGGAAVAASGSISGLASGVIDGIPESASATGTGTGISAGAGAVSPGDSLTAVFDSAQRLVSLTGITTSGQSASLTALGVPELASSDGILFWGRWTNTTFQGDVTDPARGTATGSATLPAGSYIHYVMGLPVASIPVSGSATYTFISGSGTGSTSAAGVTGAGVTAGTLTANFASNFVSTNLTVSHGSTLTATGFGFLDLSNRANFSSVTGSATGGFPFSFNGFFAGPAAPTAPARAGMAWQISLPDPIVGTAGFKCTTGC